MGLTIHTPSSERSSATSQYLDRSSFAPTKSTAKPRTKNAGTTRKPKSALVALRLENPQHILLCPPADFIDCTQPIKQVGSHQVGGPAALFQLAYTGRMRGYNDKRAEIWSCPSERVPHPGALTWPLMKSTKRTEIDLTDADGREVHLSQFYAPRNWATRTAGDAVMILGSLKRYGAKLCIDVQKEAPTYAIGTIWAQYPGIPGQISGERIEMMVKQCVDDEMAHRACAAAVLGETGMSDADLMEACGSTAERGFSSVHEVINALHRPSSVDEGLLAIEYAKRISAIGLQASALRHHLRHPHPKAPLPVSIRDLSDCTAKLPMPLTSGQIAVATEVLTRLQEPKPLSGLLSGDVGTGKTLSFLVPAIAAHRSGARVAIITPRTLLADQIADEIIKRFDGIVGDVERVPTGGRIKNFNAILVSTHGLATTASRQGYAPQLLICDEQHKFSAASRESLVAPYTHVLEVSATPVPRSLAAALYEGMEILNLRECPVKKTIHSEIVDMKERAQVIAGIRHTLNHGGVAAMIYPNVNTAEGSEGQSVTRAFESLDAAFPGQAVMLHGDMSDEEMRANIAMLRSGHKRLVVASTVLEIGIDIPSVNFMAVRDADRFGISQLHQLRGRLVRNGGVGVFMMVVEDKESTPASSLERLEAVASTNDGYRLAELDLVQRGFGELDGSAQSGNASTVFRNIKLGAADFMAKKLKTIQTEPGTRNYNSAEVVHAPRQERLI